MAHPQLNKNANFFSLQLNNRCHFYNHIESQIFLINLIDNLIKHLLFISHEDIQII